MNNSNTNQNYVDLVLSFFNQFIYQDVKSNISDIRYFFQTNAATSGNPLIEQLLGAIKDYPLESIGMPLFESILMRTGKTQAESKNILDRIIQYKKYSKDEIEPARKYMRDLVASVYVQRASKLYADSPAEYIGYLKNIDFKSAREDYLTSTKFSDIDVNSIKAEEMGGGIPSAFPWINNTFRPECTYPKMGLFCVSMPPGTGKTLFCMQECLNMVMMGKKCHYLCMGDMTASDFIIRMSAQYLGIPFYEAKRNFDLAYKELSAKIGDNLEITCIPASTITVEEYIDFIKVRDYDVCFCDYDSQFKSNVATESMYLTYGDIYAKLSELTIEYHKLVFILAQPMKAAWSLPVIEVDQVGESARKIHAVDWCLTRGREPGNLNGLGISKIVKSRRGDEQVVDYNIRLNNGRFKSLPRAVYEDLKQIDEKRDFTESEIDQMINNYIVSRKGVENDLNKKMGNSAASVPGFNKKGATPF